MQEFIHLNEITRSHHNLRAEADRLAVRNAGFVAVQLRFVSQVILENILLFGAGFSSVRDHAIRRIDNRIRAAATARRTAAGTARTSAATTATGSTAAGSARTASSASAFTTTTRSSTTAAGST